MKTDNFLKCIVDENRRNILKFLDTKEKCVCEIIEHLGLEQSLISHHLQKMKDCGLVKSRQVGKNIYYKITDKKIKNTLKQIEELSLVIKDNSRC